MNTNTMNKVLPSGPERRELLYLRDRKKRRKSLGKFGRDASGARLSQQRGRLLLK